MSLSARPRRVLTAGIALAIAGAALPAAFSPADAATVQTYPNAVRVVHAGFAALPDQPYSQVATGYWSSYGLTYDGRVVAAGEPFGQALDVPASLADETVVQISAGYKHGLALDADGDVTIWGKYLDNPATYDATVPPSVQAADVVQIAAGGNHDLALTDAGDVLAWGESDEGATAVPASVADLDVVALDAGLGGSAVLSDDGKVVSWGRVGSAPASLGDANVVAVDVGGANAIALTDEGDLVAWGAPWTGVPAIPEAVATGEVTAFAMGDSGAMAATSDGVIHQWGNFDRDILPPATGAPVVDLQLDRYLANVVYATVANLTAPSITGTPTFGEALNATAGAWSSTPEEVHYRWTSNGEPVGTDSATYTPGPDDVARSVAVTVTVTDADGVTGSATAEPVTIGAATFDSPQTVQVTGTPRVGRALTMRVTDTVPASGAIEHAWFRDGEYVAETDKYTPTRADLGHEISVGTFALRPGYEPSLVFSAPVKVAAGAAKLGVALPARTRAGAKIRLRVSGLLPGERWTATFAGTSLTSGRADAQGRIDRTVKVPHATRPGRRTLTVVGSYADRRGSDTVMVRARRR